MGSRLVCAETPELGIVLLDSSALVEDEFALTTVFHARLSSVWYLTEKGLDKINLPPRTHSS